MTFCSCWQSTAYLHAGDVLPELREGVLFPFFLALLEDLKHPDHPILVVHKHMLALSASRDIDSPHICWNLQRSIGSRTICSLAKKDY